MPRFPIRPIVLSLALALVSTPAGAETLPGPPRALDGAQLTYGLRWNGLPAARADADFAFDESVTDAGYTLDITGRTLPVIRLIYPVVTRMQARMGFDRLPRTFALWRRTRGSDRETRYAWDPEAETVHIVRTKSGDTLQDETLTSGGLLDPASVLLQAYDLASAMGTKRRVRVLLEDSVYAVDAEVVERGEYDVATSTLPAFCLAPTMVKIKPDGTEEPVTKVHDMRVWVSDDDFRLPLSMTASTSIGRITVQLAAATPSLDALYASLAAEPHEVARLAGADGAPQLQSVAGE